MDTGLFSSFEPRRNAYAPAPREVYQSTGNAQNDIQNLDLLSSGADGNTGHGMRQGSDAQYYDNQAAALKTQQQYDPWGYYRPAAAQQLAQSGNPANDPSNIYRNKLAGMVNGQFSPDDPSYQWRFQQGQQALERSQGSRGLLNSGNAAVELQQYGQGAASQEYAAQFARLLQGMEGTEQQYSSQQNRLMKMAGVDISPGVMANMQLGWRQESNKQNYLSNMDQGIASTENNDPYAGYKFG